MVVHNIVGTLYYANWCGHCKTFKPEWEQLKQQVGANSNIKLEEFEDQQLGPNQALINGQPIRGYPTLKIKVSSANKSTEYEYDGKRNANSILYHLKNDAHKNLNKK
jgi:thiol-disulfide isomerase/thioredoxin